MDIPFPVAIGIGFLTITYIWITIKGWMFYRGRAYQLLLGISVFHPKRYHHEGRFYYGALIVWLCAVVLFIGLLLLLY